jgi:MazG family protein
VQSLLDSPRGIHFAEVVEHHDGAHQQRRRICDAFSGDVGGSTVDGFEDGYGLSDVSTGDDAQPSNKARREVAHDVTIEIREQKHVELMGIEHDLHAGVVNNELLVFDIGILGGDFSNRSEKKAVRKLHDVRFVDGVNFLACVFAGVLEGEACYARGCLFRDDLQALDHAGNDGMFEARVKVFRVFADQDDINAQVAGLDALEVFYRTQVGVKFERLAEADVDARRAGCHGSCHGAFQGHAILADRVENAGLHEINSAAFEIGAGGDFVPMDLNAGGFENGFDGKGDFGADAVARNQGDVMCHGQVFILGESFPVVHCLRWREFSCRAHQEGTMRGRESRCVGWLSFATSLLLVNSTACKLVGYPGATEHTVPLHRKLKRLSRRKAKKAPRAKARAAPVRIPLDIPLSGRDKLAGRWFEKLVALQARLRAPGGCPWDREQTHDSLRKFLIEETYEVLDAMESGDARKFSSELGDLLLQVIFHAILAEEEGRFTISGVIESIHEKMVRRHPHVFGNVSAKDSATVLKNWEQIKAEERAAEGAAEAAGKVAGKGSGKKKDAPIEGGAAADSVVGGVPRSLPGVLEAYQLTRRASHVGFDWENVASIFDKLEEERRELGDVLPATTAGGKSHSPSARVEEETGDLLFACVNIARFIGVDPEIALKKANLKFKQRFQWMESAALREGRRFADLPRPRMEELWNESKAKT